MAYPPDVPLTNAPKPQRNDYDNCKDAGQAVTSAPVGSGPNPFYRRPSPLEEMEKQLAHHDESFGSISKGAAFLREHPEFNEFIHLVRTGSIGI